MAGLPKDEEAEAKAPVKRDKPEKKEKERKRTRSSPSSDSDSNSEKRHKHKKAKGDKKDKKKSKKREKKDKKKSEKKSKKHKKEQKDRNALGHASLPSYSAPQVTRLRICYAVMPAMTQNDNIYPNLSRSHELIFHTGQPQAPAAAPAPAVVSAKLDMAAEIAKLKHAANVEMAAAREHAARLSSKSGGESEFQGGGINPAKVASNFPKLTGEIVPAAPQRGRTTSSAPGRVMGAPMRPAAGPTTSADRIR